LNHILIIALYGRLSFMYFQHGVAWCNEPVALAAVVFMLAASASRVALSREHAKQVEQVRLTAGLCFTLQTLPACMRVLLPSASNQWLHQVNHTNIDFDLLCLACILSCIVNLPWAGLPDAAGAAAASLVVVMHGISYVPGVVKPVVVRIKCLLVGVQRLLVNAGERLTRVHQAYKAASDDWDDMAPASKQQIILTGYKFAGGVVSPYLVLIAIRNYEFVLECVGALAIILLMLLPLCLGCLFLLSKLEQYESQHCRRSGMSSLQKSSCSGNSKAGKRSSQRGSKAATCKSSRRSSDSGAHVDQVDCPALDGTSAGSQQRAAGIPATANSSNSSSDKHGEDDIQALDDLPALLPASSSNNSNKHRLNAAKNMQGGHAAVRVVAHHLGQTKPSPKAAAGKATAASKMEGENAGSVLPPPTLADYLVAATKRAGKATHSSKVSGEPHHAMTSGTD
jgi:hypothetical protein